jgi:hypothetical protein
MNHMGDQSGHVPPLTDEQLADLAREHFTYEVALLIAALGGLIAIQTRGDQATPAHNLHVEGVLLHARALDDFLRARRTQRDDLLATDYLPGWQPLEVLHDDARRQINKQGPHLTTIRLTKHGFDLVGIVHDVLRGVLAFVEKLPSDRRAWFADAEQLAREVLTRIGPAQAGPRFSPTQRDPLTP